MSFKRPIIGISMGDPAGIGPEILVKTLARKEIYEICNPVIVGDAKVISKAVENLDWDLKVRSIREVQQAEYEYGVTDVIDLQMEGLEKIEYGKVSKPAGQAAFQSIKKVIEMALDKTIDATVTGPINKEALNLAGHRFSGHTEIFSEFTKTKNYAMMLVKDNFRIVHVTTHLPLVEACKLIKKERIFRIIQLSCDACRTFGIKSPKIGVAGLNPHAGDGGLFGSEEKEEILPAVELAQAEGIDAKGPIPGDTLFSKTLGGGYDVAIAMYHDQGHIPFKLVGFTWDQQEKKWESVKGVNITLGLPIVRTSVDHGTAFDIAGKGIANEDSLVSAIEYAALLGKVKK
jgi:4-hydroxythreonine-4-phosphate dehydrogenase